MASLERSQDEAYKAIIEDRLKKIKKQINHLEVKEFDKLRHKQRNFLGRLRKGKIHERTINKRQERIYGLKAEKEQLEMQLNNYTNREFTLSDRKEKQLEEYDEAKREVQAEANLNINKNKQNLLARLKEKGALITDKQYKILLPKAKLFFIKQAFLYREIGKESYLSEKREIVDANAKENAHNTNWMKKHLLNILYKYQQNKLDRRITYRQKKIDEFQAKNAVTDKNLFVLFGTSIIVQAKEVVERISEKFSGNTNQPTR